MKSHKKSLSHKYRFSCSISLQITPKSTLSSSLHPKNTHPQVNEWCFYTIFVYIHAKRKRRKGKTFFGRNLHSLHCLVVPGEYACDESSFPKPQNLQKRKETMGIRPILTSSTAEGCRQLILSFSGSFSPQYKNHGFQPL